MSRDNGIDLMRLVGAFFIVLIHSQLGSMSISMAGNLKLLGRWAVPFYFIVSGYFLGIKYYKTNFINIDSIKKLIGIYIISNILYLPVTILKNKMFHTGIIPPNIELLIYGCYWHLWYVNSLIFGIITLWYFISAKQFFVLNLLSLLILLLLLFVNSYSLFLNINTPIDFYRFFLSIPFLFIGFAFARRENQNRSFFMCLLLIILGASSQYFEANFFTSKFNYGILNHNFLIGTIPLAIGVFLLSRRLSIKDNFISTWGRNYSLFIYIFHPIVILFLNIIIQKLFPIQGSIVLQFSPIITFSISLLIGITINNFFPKLFRILNGDLFRRRLVKSL